MRFKVPLYYPIRLVRAIYGYVPGYERQRGSKISKKKKEGGDGSKRLFIRKDGQLYAWLLPAPPFCCDFVAS
jgi:hypothetical protein